MVFKDKKVPKHLIIHDDYMYQQRSKNSFLKFAIYALLLLCLSYSVLLITP
tara:strand:+ start:233228 stop:233380 length:153 start_codon:yes stop_codon:yes gene_type:complete